MLRHRLTRFVAIFLCLLLARSVESSDAPNTKSVNGKTLFFVVEDSTQNADALQYLKDNIDDVLSTIDPNWFSQYIVIGFDLYNILFHGATFNASEVYSLLEQAQLQKSILGNWYLPLMDVLLQGFSYYSFAPQSVVYLITKGGSSGFDQDKAPLFYNIAYRLQVQVQYVLLPYSNKTFFQWVDEARFFGNVAINSHGNFIQLTPEEIPGYMKAHLPTLYNSVDIRNPAQCANTTYNAVVEANVGTVYLYFYSEAHTDLSVNGPHSTVSLKTLFDDGNTRLLSFVPTDGTGVYAINLNSQNATAFCTFQLRFQGKTSSQIPKTPATISSTPAYGYHDVKADITLFLDVGGDVSYRQKSDIRFLLYDALSQFDVGWEKNLHVSIISVYGNDIDVALVSSRFNTIHDERGLGKAIDSVYDGFSTQGGQYALQEAFNMSISPNELSGGYRTNINNHLIIYATTNGTADVLAISAAASVMKSGMYSVAAVAYGANGSNTESLTALVGGKPACVITPNVAFDLKDAADSLAKLILNAANNNGVYC